MSDDSLGTLFVAYIVTMLLGVVLLVGMPRYHDAKYSLGASVSTTAEYNNTFNDSFSGHIIARGREGITVQNESGEEKTLCEKWLKVGEKS